MRTFTSLLIGLALALAGNAIAQPQPTEQQTPATQPQPGANQANPEAAGGKQRGGKRQRAANAASQDQNIQQNAAAQGQGQGTRQGRGGGKRQKQQATQATGAKQSAATTTATAAPNARQQARQERQQARQERKNARKGRGAGANAQTTTDANAPATGAGAATSTAVGPNNRQAGQANATGRGKRKLEQQKVQQIRQQHAGFRAQPKPDRVPAVTFNQNHRIQNSERWHGPRYEVFRSYRPQWHDQGWYRSHYPRIELIGGGYYYFNNGYWFPAWGYSPAHQYYVYDGPIYVGQRAVPPDQVIADVQAALQEMGYYRGEVDGLVGPLTREALAAYQADEGLTPTAAIDEPTLESLGMA